MESSGDEGDDDHNVIQVGDREDVELMYRFYTDLRDEINQSIETQNKVVIGGGVLIGLAYGLQLSGVLDELVMKNPTLKLIIAALPTLIILTISLWIVEQSRMMRAGHYLAFIENKINSELDGVYLTWENWLQDSEKPIYHDAHYVGQVVGYVLFLYGLAVLGLLMYAYELLELTVGSVMSLSIPWFSIEFLYFMLNIVLLLYLSKYTYLIIFHDTDTDADFDSFRKWEQGYAKDKAFGVTYQHKMKTDEDSPDA
ncbi:hypothetical protein N0B31_14885 [Salinirubellus salinus]|uniref:Uncharacterized protein n=1 Tax=Salinirubellus salinus TaxID=1364945 RepID=A0A9E7R0H2_9EURY|nr:hypothetical protein [Salinirubellus salinus]UWM53421.1 hypothetical protein N0B31_14885 [Salinirubellus salinus]